MKLSILLVLIALVRCADGFSSFSSSSTLRMSVGLPKPPVVGPKTAAEVKAKFGDKSKWRLICFGRAERILCIYEEHYCQTHDMRYPELTHLV